MSSFDDDGPIDRRSSDSASGNATGNVGHADEVGDYDFDTESQQSMSSNDSLDDVSHASTWTRSTVFKSEYEMYIELFEKLETDWLHERDPLQQQSLYSSVQEAEVAFALKYGIYSDLVTGNQTELSVAKDKTRNRMRTRLKNECCIGLPVKGRAVKRTKRIKIPRSRVDAVTRQIISWSSFQQLHNSTPHKDLVRLWYKLPRVRRPAKARLWSGYCMTWSQCVDWYRDYYDMSELYTWYVELPRAD